MLVAGQNYNISGQHGSAQELNTQLTWHGTAVECLKRAGGIKVLVSL